MATAGDAAAGDAAAGDAAGRESGVCHAAAVGAAPAMAEAVMAATATATVRCFTGWPPPGAWGGLVAISGPLMTLSITRSEGGPGGNRRFPPIVS
jgi:hypothetical protein